MKIWIGLSVCAVAMSGCATLSNNGEKVTVATSVESSCKNLGPVTVTITGWGLPQESMNVLRNNTADVGGNTLVQTSNHTGVAYSCPAGETASN